MKGREGKGPPAADLLACFPSGAHLTLMSKQICNPARFLEADSRPHHHRRRYPHRGRGSPLTWPKTKPNNSDNSEPTSPKITCAGQIKVRPKPSSCKNWQSVMEEIERVHNSRKKKKRPPWIESFGLKKDVMQFLTCLRNIRFDFRCFGSFPSVEITSDAEDEDEEEEEESYRETVRPGSKEESDGSENPRTVFSKWFMVLHENDQSKELDQRSMDSEDDDGACAPPPPNALLLMRCRSAPAKSWLEEKEEEEITESEEKEKEKQSKTEEAERLLVIRCGTDFSKVSCDIAKETWVVGGTKDLLSRSRSWRR